MVLAMVHWLILNSHWELAQQQQQQQLTPWHHYQTKQLSVGSPTLRFR